jgi:hypothetical protein
MRWFLPHEEDCFKVRHHCRRSTFCQILSSTQEMVNQFLYFSGIVYALYVSLFSQKDSFRLHVRCGHYEFYAQRLISGNSGSLTRKYIHTIWLLKILYLNFKVSNQKAKFVPREREIHHRIAPYVIVFDVSGWLESYHSGDLIMCHLGDGDHASKMADKIY